ncbi:MAG: hypothetical protein K6U88_13265, partial [Dehalococcoidia bacterium]|nr:hypothetical protein [Dehalococcoidia bacterium]
MPKGWGFSAARAGGTSRSSWRCARTIPATARSRSKAARSIPSSAPRSGASPPTTACTAAAAPATATSTTTSGQTTRSRRRGRCLLRRCGRSSRISWSAWFPSLKIYNRNGQLYTAVDADLMLAYKESEIGQILHEGINEAGSLASFIAAGTSGYTHGVTMVPFFWFYSMFGLQRFGDLAWAAAELRTKGFLVGGLAGRTQLAGEGLQHQDGHSHLLAYPIPNLKAYDPAFAFEIAAIVKDGLRRMFVEGEDVFYYFTVGNENYVQQPMPKGKNVEEGIVRGMYLFRKSGLKKPAHRAQLLGSGSIMNEVLKAQEMLEKYGVAADVWSVTSYKELYRDAIETERWNLLHPEAKPKVPYVRQLLEDTEGPIVA